MISTWNVAAQRLFGYSAEEAVGRPITIIIPPELHDEEKDILRRLRAGQCIENYETRRVTRDRRCPHPIKHSGTDRVEVKLRGGPDQIELRIDDFGVGFDSDEQTAPAA